MTSSMVLINAISQEQNLLMLMGLLAIFASGYLIGYINGREKQ